MYYRDHDPTAHSAVVLINYQMAYVIEWHLALGTPPWQVATSKYSIKHKTQRRRPRCRMATRTRANGRGVGPVGPLAPGVPGPGPNTDSGPLYKKSKKPKAAVYIWGRFFKRPLALGSGSRWINDVVSRPLGGRKSNSPSTEKQPKAR
jgi:hypothetical protein